MLPILPYSTLCNGRMTMWQQVVELVMSGSVTICDDVTGLLVVLVKSMTDEELQVSLL